MNRFTRVPAEVAIAAALFAFALVVYLLTLSPGLSYNSIDGNEMATVPSQLGLLHKTGYPVYTWMGKAFSLLPIGEVAFRANLLSAVSAAGTVALLSFAVVLLGRGAAPIAGLRSEYRDYARFGAAVFAALLLAFSGTFWSQAVIAEVYTPNTLLLTAALVLLLFWGRHEERLGGRDAADPTSVRLFAAFALVYGLSLGTHLSNLAFAPGIVFFVLLTNRYFLLQPRLLGAGLLGFGLGALQFVWLPLKAGEADIAASARPDDLRGIYEYTFGAFPQFRWFYPLSELPERIGLYVDLVLADLYLPGVLLALAGAWAMLWRHPKAFYLLLGAYLPHVFFFLEYNVVDIEVFFLASHLIVVMFVGFGLMTIAELVLAHAARIRTGIPVVGAIVVFVGLLPVYALADRWAENDESENTGINDFYTLVFQRLPQDAMLSGSGGVTGYDLFYYPIVDDPRPDILIRPAPNGVNGTAGTDLSPRASFTVTSGFIGRAPAAARDRTSWLVPVLSAPTVPFDERGGRRLTLFSNQAAAPELFVANPSPDVRVDREAGDLTLLGYDLDSRTVIAGGSVHLRLYWASTFQGLYSVSTQVGDAPYFENHDLGFGNISRYIAEVRSPAPGEALVEEYDLVVLSSLAAGEHRLRVRTIAAAGGASEWLEIGTIEVRP